MKRLQSISLAAVLALALALGVAPGPAEAQLCSKPKKGCVVKKDIKKNAVDSSRVKNNSLKGADIKDGTLTGTDVQNNSLTGADVQDQSLSGTDFQDGGVGAADLAPGAESDTLADLGCSTDQVARSIDGAWDCVTGGASYVFISTNSIAGNVSLADMDAECEASAAAAGINTLPAGTYRAWLSTSAFDARDRLPPGPFYLTDGTLLALSKADLLDDSIFALIDLRSNKVKTLISATSVWTGTSSDGTHSGASCNGWSPSGTSGTRGNRTVKNAGWTQDVNSACDQLSLLYCFQVQ